MRNEQTLKKEETVYEKAKSLFLSGEIEPGHKITEALLAEKMGTSRIPIREAIQTLVFEGFIERSGKKGFQAKEYKEKDIIDLYNYREALEGMLTRQFTQRADNFQIYYLEMNIKAMSDLLVPYDLDSFTAIDLNFHKTIANGANNPYMEEELGIVIEKILFIVRPFASINKESSDSTLERSLNETLEQHRALLEAVKMRQPVKAEEVARDLVKQGLNITLDLFKKAN